MLRQLSLGYLLFFAIGNVSGFVTNPSLNSLSRASKDAVFSPRFMSDDDFAPSDSSNDDHFENTAAKAESTNTEARVTDVLDLIPSSLGEATKEETAAINEVIFSLERLNPTPYPATSSLLTGAWELRYVGGYSNDWALSSPTRQLALFLYSGGYSPGIFALGLANNLPAGLVSAGDVEIIINDDGQQPRVESRVDLKLFGGAESEVSLKVNLDVLSDVRLRETYESATVLGNSVNIPSQVKYERELYVTYLDDELLVVRDASGVPEVLVRKD